MNLEELKSAWQVFDKKVQTSQVIHAKIIESMIKERSGSRVDAIKRQSYSFMIILIIEIIALLGVILGNPFDFKYGWQYIPYYILLGGVVLAFINLVKTFQKINQTWSHLTIDAFLTNMLNTYEKNKVFEKWFGTIFLSIGFIIPISFLPAKIERNGLQSAILDVALMMGVTALLYLVAFKMGAFKNHHKDHFEQDLKELNELKGLIQE